MASSRRSRSRRSVPFRSAEHVRCRRRQKSRSPPSGERMPRIVITMPAYQAERTLRRTVLAIPMGVADELILVDDASRDGTADLARQLGLEVHVHSTNR